MIYSYDHDFLMIKNRKVGSSSTEVELSQILPDNAIVTPMLPANVKHVPRNHDGFYNHMSIAEVSERLDLSNTTSAVFVRNPYRSVMSHMFYQIYAFSLMDDFTSSDENRSNIIDKYFKDEVRAPWLRSSKDLYTLDEKIAVTHILKYEDGLGESLNPVLESVGIPRVTFESKEKAHSPLNITYQELFTPIQMEMITDEWLWEFNNLGYQIESEGIQYK